ncbi:sulfotransferase domain-containing protein [Yoonia sp. R2-816]
MDTMTAQGAPSKTRDIQNHHMDSTIWDSFTFRDDDIIVASYAKAGTTWTQQIIGQLIFDGRTEPAAGQVSPWVDLRVPPPEVKLPMLEAQTHRRFLKTHLPVDALVFSPKVKYVYVARDGRDLMWSLHNHHHNANDQFFSVINDTPGRVGPALDRAPEDPVAYFRQWLDGDGYPFWSLWENMRSWWAIRDLPNVLMVHFNDLKADMEGEIRRIADFLDIAPTNWDAILRHCSFDYMKTNADAMAPMGGALWEGGGATFINKGTNGRWQASLPAADSAAYEARAIAELGAECAAWMMNGRR